MTRRCSHCRRDYDLRRRYGISVDEYTAILERQGHRCALCSGVCASGRRLAVDHCHDSGRVRGLLCFRCNAAIGKVAETADQLQRLIEYLR